MIIEEIMKTELITLKQDDNIEKAHELIYKNGIRHIPIIDDQNEVIGILSDRDVRDAMPSVFHCDEHLEDLQKPVSTIMIHDVITGHPLDFVEEVAALFYEHNIGCLPVVSNEKLVGIVTETDVLHTLVQLTGADQPSSRIEVKVQNKTGVLSEVSSVFRKCKVNIISVFVHPELTKASKSKILVFRVQTMNPTGVISELKGEGYEVLWPNLPGVSS